MADAEKKPKRWRTLIAFAIVAKSDHAHKLLNKLLTTILAEIERASRDLVCSQQTLLLKHTNIAQTIVQFHSIEAIAIDQITGYALDIEAFGVSIKEGSSARRFVACGVFVSGPAARMTAHTSLGS